LRLTPGVRDGEDDYIGRLRKIRDGEWEAPHHEASDIQVLRHIRPPRPRVRRLADHGDRILDRGDKFVAKAGTALW
jgi:hypothetical protein